MPIETYIVIGAAIAMFGTFGAALAWGYFRTRDLWVPFERR